jgi:hypothetical protein
MKYHKVSIIFLFVPLFGCTIKESKKSDGGPISTIDSFEFGGAYLPKEEIMIGNFLFTSFEVVTDGSPGNSVIKQVFVRFTNMGDGEEYHVMRATVLGGTRDKFYISALDSLLGDIRIQGRFFGTRGPMLDDVEDTKVIVFEGQFVARKQGIDESIKCTYFGGD